MRRIAATVVLSSLLAGSVVWSQGRAHLGAQFQVNTYTTNIQANPAVAADGQNNFVVVWHSNGSYGPDPDFSIQGQRYNANGTLAGGEFEVNSYTNSFQGYAKVAVAPQGDFVVVWESYSSTYGSGRSVQGQLFDSDGVAVGTQFHVNSYTTGAQQRAAVAVDSQGKFVVTWHSYGSYESDPDSSIQAQRYNANGTPDGGQFQVNSHTTDNQYNPAIGFDGVGNFVVVWDSDSSAGTDTSETSIQAQRFSANGTPAGSQFQVNTLTTLDQTFPSIGVGTAGDFVVTWQSNGSGGTDTSDYGIRAQFFNATGTKVGGEFQVNTYTTSGQVRPDISKGARGDFVVAWTSYGSSGSDTSASSVQGQSFSATGMPIGGEFQVNTYTPSYQAFSSVALRPAGDFVVVWHSALGDDTDVSTNSVQGQFLSSKIFVDAIESGDTSAWSFEVP